MANYFYTDADGNKQGPLTIEQLQALAEREIIKPDTPLTTDGGHTGLARQIRGLNFNATAESPSFTQTSQAAQQIRDKAQTVAKQAGEWAKKEGIKGFRTWLLDFAFRDLRLPVINLWLSRIVYAICCLVAVIVLAVATIFLPFRCLELVFERDFSMALTGICIVLPLFWLGTLLCVILIRLSLESYIILFDWVVETTKAAKHYNENRES